MAYTGNAWDEDKPANTRAISLGDDDIREVKAQIGEFFDREHSLDRNTGGEAGSDSLANNGQHRVPGTEGHHQCYRCGQSAQHQALRRYRPAG